LTPLYHGVELCRGAVLHTLGVVDALVHVAVLAVLWFVGLALSIRIFARRVAE
jgi:lipooligosaccharide transport system permease protein